MNKEMNKAVMVFAESCVPALQSGEYIMSVTQKVDALGNSAVEKQEIFVEGPRFSLNQSDIHSVYPPSGMTGSFGLSLPHAIFNRKTLPWERSTQKIKNTDASAPESARPWLAVILLSGSEIVESTTATVKDAVNPTNSDTFFPRLLIKKNEENELCRFIELDAEMFRDIIPKPSESALLAHSRESNPQAQAFREAVTDNWVSLVICNRLPSQSEKGSLNKAYVVSLEGFDDYSEITKQNKTHVRLIELYSWEFYSVIQPLHLKEMLIALDVRRIAAPAPNASGEMLKKITQNGFLPTIHKLRNGDRTVSFYRGPFSPSAAKSSEYTASDADQLYKYDPQNAMFDISYAVAWQQGRLVALSNQSIALKIMKQRSKNHVKIHKEESVNMLRRNFICDSETAGLSLLEYFDMNPEGLL